MKRALTALLAATIPAACSTQTPNVETKAEGAKTAKSGSQVIETRIGRLEFTHDFDNGLPSDAAVEKLYDERDFQRACQAYLWSLPAVSFTSWQRGITNTLGARNGQVVAILSYEARRGILTANATTPYYLGFADISSGPLVMVMPPRGVQGGISDAWQMALPDSEKPGKYLLLGPGQKTPADVAGYEVRHSPTFNIFLGVRLTDPDPGSAKEALSHLQMYPYAQRANPPKTEILTEAALVGEAMAKANSADRRFADVKYRSDAQWDFALQLDADHPGAFWNLLDERASWFYEAVGAGPSMAPKRPGLSSAYLGTYKDKAGQWLDGGKSYRLRVPPHPPIKLFWSVTVYDVDTRALILNEQKIADRSSRMDLRKNEDGSVDIHCGPKAPDGFEKNWIPTVPGRNWFAYFRFYQPTETYFDRSWPLPDFEQVSQ
jgi:hypothetical protein